MSRNGIRGDGTTRAPRNETVLRSMDDQAEPERALKFHGSLRPGSLAPDGVDPLFEPGEPVGPDRPRAAECEEGRCQSRVHTGPYPKLEIDLPGNRGAVSLGPSRLPVTPDRTGAAHPEWDHRAERFADDPD